MKKPTIYIPLEIERYFSDEIRIGREQDIVNRVYKKLKDKYSILSYKDFVNMYISIQNNEFETAPNFFEGDLTNQDFVVKDWLAKFRDILDAMYGHPDAYSLKIFLLLILDSVEKKIYSGNFIYLNQYTIYTSLWWKLKSPLVRTVPNFYKVFVTLRDYGFYDVKTIDDADLNSLTVSHKIWKYDDIIDYIDYGFISDPVLFDLIFLDSFRNKLVEIIIDSL
ncbi:MAG: hypothetical protein HDS79_03685 [Bacteroidales bacterium]|nr:hypothetical protein [Bacteroidales bacterium]